jgi:hypothetical protein
MNNCRISEGLPGQMIPEALFVYTPFLKNS